MYYIAFSLGLLSSLHCVGMCGPLALAGQGLFNKEFGKVWVHAILYNAGRIFSYMLLGIIFGLFGTILAFTGYQKGISIFSGMVLILLFLFSVQPDAWLGKKNWVQKLYGLIQKNFGKLAGKHDLFSRVALGMMNGFLPCGMVYIALAGAISLQNTFGAMGFMLFFGLGTFPAMVGVMIAGKWFKNTWRGNLQKIYPVVTLLLGIYLIYRGIFSSTPLELNFMEALKNPVMCH